MNKNKILKNTLILCLFIFFIISLLSIYSASKITYISKTLVYKQLIWYVIGFIIIIIINKINIKKILNYTFIFYIICIVLLVLLLFLGKEINGSKSWFIIPSIGSIEPSEFMKIAIIIMNAKIFGKELKNNKKRNIKKDLWLFFRIIFLTFIPGILTFLQPDTGMVIIYFLISFIMLFSFGIKKRIFTAFLIIGITFLLVFLYLYNCNEILFSKIFGSDFYYRINRILDWKNNSNIQTTNALASIKAAGLLGFGLAKTPIYFPEAHTDFIFSIFSSNFGFIGSIVLILTICIFDISLITISLKEKNVTYKYIIIGFVIMIMYQQLQNISMNLGLLPVTGITLPFISYGGSSLVTYMFMIGIILNINKKTNYN